MFPNNVQKMGNIDEEEKTTEDTVLRHTTFQEFWVGVSTVNGDTLTPTG